MLWILFSAGLVITYTVTELSIRLSLHRGVLDVPNERSSHCVPVPRMGGLGILSGFYVSMAALGGLGRLGFVQFAPFSRDILVILLAGAGMAAIGLADDLHHFEPGTKFLMQFGIAAMVVVFGIRFEQAALPAWGPLDLRVLTFPLTILWLTGFSNVYNFMDGINGLGAGTGALYGIFFFILAWLLGCPGLAAIALLLSGSSIGFLFHNYPEARTFMGDGGSLFLGMVFALLVVRLTQQSSNTSCLVAQLLLCSVYLYDSGFTLIRRLRHGENIFRAHRSHLYQRLVMAGLSHVMITNSYLFMNALMGICSVLYLLSPESTRWWLLGFASMVFLVFTLGVYRIENRVSRSSEGIKDSPARSSHQGKPHN